MKKNKPRYEQTGVAMTSRSFDEYMKMFSLNSKTLQQGKILDVASGASSFNAEANNNGYDCTSVDPSYELTYDEMSTHGSNELKGVTEKLSNIEHVFDWSYYQSVEKYQELREKSYGIFKKDYRSQHSSPKYIAGTLPSLSIKDNTFSLILCSHFLFLYHEQFNLEFHLQSILELFRICNPGGEIRIYPLVTLSFEPYPHLDELSQQLQNSQPLQVQKLKSNLPFIPNSPYALSLKKME